MGVLVAFTIPPLLQVPASSQSAKYNAMAKDTAFMILMAYEQYRYANPTVASSVSAGSITPYMNYVRVDTSGASIDWHPTLGSLSCAPASPCLRLHNGGALTWYSLTFGGTASTNTIEFVFDPDGVYSGSSSNNSSKSVQFEVYYDGYIRTRGSAKSNTVTSGGSFGPDTSLDPVWFTGF
jgi:hypothetical protein